MTQYIKIFLIILLLTGCVTTEDRGLTKSSREDIYSSCFEVVIKKNAVDNLTYEKNLPYDKLPYNIRTDKYHSIGTAFLISEDTLLTAFHVLNLSKRSFTPKEYFIRDTQGNIFEIGDIVKFSSNRDFAIFKVKDKKFNNWFDLETSYTINESVFSVGNAYGEGIIIRDGNLIGTLPENENGEWELLRSSSDVNSGNSGGPLLNSRGKVIGVVIMKKDNIAYSLPIGEVLNFPENSGVFRQRINYGFTLTTETTGLDTYNLELKLPMSYGNIKSEYVENYRKYYIEMMNKFFLDREDRIFPKGESSREALILNTTSIMPQVVIQNKADKKWVMTNPGVKNSNLRDNGILSYSGLSKTTMMLYIKKPDSISLKELNSNDKMVMDLVLEGLNVPRTMAGEEIRVTSFGEPISRDFIKDSFNREWRKTLWVLNHSDEYIITYSMPTPEGTAVILHSGFTYNLSYLEYDYTKLLDFVEIGFYGKYSEWLNYLQLETIPERMKSIEISRVNRDISLDTPQFKVKATEGVIRGDDDTVIILDFDIFNRDAVAVWDLRRVVFNEYKRDNFIEINKTLKPEEELRVEFHNSWENRLNRVHPFSGIPFNDKGLTNLGMVLNYNQGQEIPDVLYTLYVGKEGRVDDLDLENEVNKIEVEIKE